MSLPSADAAGMLCPPVQIYSAYVFVYIRWCGQTDTSISGLFYLFLGGGEEYDVIHTFSLRINMKVNAFCLI